MLLPQFLQTSSHTSRSKRKKKAPALAVTPFWHLFSSVSYLHAATLRYGSMAAKSLLVPFPVPGPSAISPRSRKRSSSGRSSSWGSTGGLFSTCLRLRPGQNAEESPEWKKIIEWRFDRSTEKTKLSNEFNESCHQKHFIWTKIQPTLPIGPGPAAVSLRGSLAPLVLLFEKNPTTKLNQRTPVAKIRQFCWGFKLHHWSLPGERSPWGVGSWRGSNFLEAQKHHKKWFLNTQQSLAKPLTLFNCTINMVYIHVCFMSLNDKAFQLCYLPRCCEWLYRTLDRPANARRSHHEEVDPWIVRPKMPANLKDTPSKRPSSTDDHLQAEVQKGLPISSRPWVLWTSAQLGSCRKPWNCPEISLHHVDQNGIQVLFELDPHFMQLPLGNQWRLVNLPYLPEPRLQDVALPRCSLGLVFVNLSSPTFSFSCSFGWATFSIPSHLPGFLDFLIQRH